MSIDDDTFTELQLDDIEHGARLWTRIREEQGEVRVPLGRHRDAAFVLRGVREAAFADPVFEAEWITERDHAIEVTLEDTK